MAHYRGWNRNVICTIYRLNYLIIISTAARRSIVCVRELHVYIYDYYIHVYCKRNLKNSNVEHVLIDIFLRCRQATTDVRDRLWFVTSEFTDQSPFDYLRNDYTRRITL